MSFSFYYSISDFGFSVVRLHFISCVMACVLRPSAKFVAINLQVACRRNFMMSAQLRAEQAIEKMKKKNPYFDKYAEKIAKLQQASPVEFLNRLDSMEKTKAPKRTEKPRDYSELLRPKSNLPSAPGEIPYKKLDDIMKLDLLTDKTAEQTTKIWLDYHKEKDVLVATIPTETFDLLMARAKDYPLFIFPLPRSQGFEFFLLQFASNTVHFTPLLCYQVHKENAPECLNIVHYTEFSEKHGIVLMRAEYDTNVINAQEAQCLANQLQLYYSQYNESKLELLKRFTREPDSFKHMDVIKELENLTIQ